MWQKVAKFKGAEYFRKALYVPNKTVASIILKWKKFGTTKTLPRAGLQAILNNH